MRCRGGRPFQPSSHPTMASSLHARGVARSVARTAATNAPNIRFEHVKDVMAFLAEVPGESPFNPASRQWRGRLRPAFPCRKSICIRRSLKRLARRVVYLMRLFRSGWRRIQNDRTRQKASAVIRKLIQIQTSLTATAWTIDEQGDCAQRARVWIDENRRRDVRERQRFRSSWGHFSVYRTEATDLPALETAATTLVGSPRFQCNK